MKNSPHVGSTGLRKSALNFPFIAGCVATLVAGMFLACSTTPTLTDEFEEALALAEAGRSSAQTRVGFLFMTGRGVQKNKKQAIRWYSEAAKQGDPQAIDALWEVSGREMPTASPSIAVGLPRQETPGSTPERNIEFGTFHALVIGNANYSDLPPLVTTTNDALEVSRILRQEYNFKVTTLLDGSWEEMRVALSSYRKALTEADNLLVYYAGHGWVDPETEEAYWMPVDASADSDVRWISNATLATTLRGIAAHHIIIIADSCFAGTLVRGLSIRPGGRASFVQRLNDKRSRTALTSGGVEPVVDSGENGHSVFANAFLGALSDNPAVIDGTSLFGDIRRSVMLKADQTPLYGDIRKAGHDDGDFLFVRVASPVEEGQH